MTRPRRIVVCDRSAGRARALTRVLERDPGLEVAAAFGAVEAMVPRLAEIAPDLIALDLATAGADVGAAIKSVAREGAVPILILGNGAEEGDGRVAAGLGAGALEAIDGERLDLDRPDGIWATVLRSRFKRLANHHSGRHAAAEAPPGPVPPIRPVAGATYRAIGIGASVGGPPALATVLGGLPADFAVPVLIVQHLADGFGASLAQWLDRTVAIPVALAEDGEALRPGAWLAPEGAHLRLARTLRLSLDRSTVRGSHRPSLDVLLESLADSLGAASVGVVLTGMGRDGADGIRALNAAGGLTIAQDEESSAVFGMPAAAIDSGVGEVLKLDRMARRLATLRAREELR
jgi:chemotaxis response regulator CheB